MESSAWWWSDLCPLRNWSLSVTFSLRVDPSPLWHTHCFWALDVQEYISPSYLRGVGEGVGPHTSIITEWLLYQHMEVHNAYICLGFWSINIFLAFNEENQIICRLGSPTCSEWTQKARGARDFCQVYLSVLSWSGARSTWSPLLLQTINSIMQFHRFLFLRSVFLLVWFVWVFSVQLSFYARFYARCMEPPCSICTWKEQQHQIMSVSINEKRNKKYLIETIELFHSYFFLRMMLISNARRQVKPQNLFQALVMHNLRHKHPSPHRSHLCYSTLRVQWTKTRIFFTTDDEDSHWLYNNTCQRKNIPKIIFCSIFDVTMLPFAKSIFFPSF